ncbi:envelope stress response membrane protein PspB [Stakelama saccharophila]|uniref:Envelope stress response membrane protein PspB n=1 Tax=Stakelama saccharophila TaxID=3075605 RepID=A0ABZ0B621_9SPHN|nr:envelope stress response membrane protein PspB [Stakelama sp. W311]WNO52759.1 envelope stress response membrane protein PspB [Stakelama sp. W311]
MEDVFLPIIIVGMLFIGLPWVVMHYVTKWKQSATLTGEDEKLLDELHYTARRLEDRLQTIERIIAADNPDFRPQVPSTPPMSEIDYSRRN